ncbi:MAG: ABC transporter permease [Caulobacteraceae bacterium]
MDAVEGAVRDIVDGFRLTPLWSRLGWEQTIARFRRTILGPFWLTANLLAISFALAFVFGALSGVGYRATFASIIGGVLVWNLIGGVLGEASSVFIASAGLMHTMKLPLTFHVLLLMHRAFINFMAQLIAFWVVLALMRLGALPTWHILLSLPLVLVNMTLMSLIVAIPSTRFRDINQTVLFLTQILFFLTPVFWVPASSAKPLQLVARYSPFAHLLELIRQPLLGHAPMLLSWEFGLGTLVIQLVVVIVMLAMFRKRVVFWI